MGIGVRGLRAAAKAVLGDPNYDVARTISEKLLWAANEIEFLRAELEQQIKTTLGEETFNSPTVQAAFNKLRAKEHC